MEIIMLAIVCLSNIICFALGAGIAQKLRRGEDIQFPDPVKKIQEIKQTQEHKKEQEAIEDMLYNIDVYDGTDLGQRELRR